MPRGRCLDRDHQPVGGATSPLHIHRSEISTQSASAGGTSRPEPDYAEPLRVDPAAGPGFRVLIVDDSDDAAQMLSIMLRYKGHSTCIALDGLEALRLAEEFRPEVAVLDIGLPGMDGYELAVLLRERPSLRGLKLVAVTGYGQESDRERARRAGFHQHLLKPVTIEMIDRAVRSVRAGEDHAVMRS